MLKKLLVNILLLFQLPLYLLSFIIPRNKKIWVFGAWFGQRYSDNARYLFEYVCKNQKDIRPIWLTHNKDVVSFLKAQNKEVYLINSFLGYWYSCRAVVAVFSSGLFDVNRLGLSRAIKYQLWHGIPLKKIGLDDKISYSANKSKVDKILAKIKDKLLPFVKESGNYDAIISTSLLVSKYFKTAFNIEEDRIFITGFPRTDIILNENPDRIPVLDELKLKYNAQKIIGYFPTFRNDDNVITNIFNNLNVKEMDLLLEKHNAIMVIKMHYINAKNGTFRDKIKNSRIILLEEKIVPDINPLLPWIDVLLTDYSSVYFDYVLLQRPIIFTPFDYNDYLTNDRELYEDYDLFTPGEKCLDWTGVINALDDIFLGDDKYYAARKELIEKYYIYQDTNNSKRVFTAVKERFFED